MIQFFSLVVLFAFFHSFTLFDFNSESDLSNWQIVDDGVMGGKSAGNFGLNEAGNGVFEGQISLDNNGGFSSLRYNTGNIEVADYTKFCIYLKGDGKKYQFRVKAQTSDSASFVTYFTTTGDWQTIEVPLNDLYPTFRGRKLNQPNFSGDSIEEIGFLFGNKKEESFQLEIGYIELK